MTLQFPMLVLDPLLIQFTRSLYRRTRHQKQLTSDNMRSMGLDNYLRDPQHEVGLYCTAMLWRGWLKEVSRLRSAIESNHGREIRVFKWTERASVDLE